MNQDKLTVAVIGGTGKSGKYLLNKLRHEPVYVRALVRDPSRLVVNYADITVLVGDVKQYECVDELLKGCDAVISTLGMGIPPDEPTVFSTGTRNILAAMAKHGIRRYIVITGLNVDVPGDRKNDKVKFATSWMYEHYPRSTKDRQEEFDLLARSSADWTLVRLPMIEQTETASDFRIDLHDCRSEKISAASLANFLVKQLDDDMYVRKAPFIGNV